jgi:hypothetical protein
MKEDDNNWPMPDRVGKQELEIKMNGEHICFNTTKLGSVLQVQQSKDPDGLRIFYYLVQVRDSREGLEAQRGTPVSNWTSLLGATLRTMQDHWVTRPGCASHLHQTASWECCQARLTGRCSVLLSYKSACCIRALNMVMPATRSFCQRVWHVGKWSAACWYVCLPPCLQDLKCFVFSLISAHFKIQPIQK